MQEATGISAAKRKGACLTSALYLNVMYPCAQNDEYYVEIERIFPSGQYFLTVLALLNPSFAVAW